MKKNSTVATNAKKMNGDYYVNFSDFITALKEHESSPAYVAKDGKLHIIARIDKEVKADDEGCFDGFYLINFHQGDDSISACLNFVKDCPDVDVKWWFSGSCLGGEIPSYEEEKEYDGGLSGINGWSLYRKYKSYLYKIGNAIER